MSIVWVVVGAVQGWALCLRVYGADCLRGMARIVQEVSYCWDGCGWRCECMGIGEWIAAVGCGVGWRERCGENVLIAPAWSGEALVGHCIEVSFRAWKPPFWLPIHAV